MKLVLINNEGEVREITDELEGYDLSKSIARADLCNDIEEALLTFKDVEDD